MMLLPNILTFSRILIIPLLIVFFYLPYQWGLPACAVLFALAMLTDVLDGYLARRFKQQTTFGAFLDPVADKLVISTALVLIASRDQALLTTVACVIIIGREIAVSALREWMAELGRRSLVAVSLLAKIKTAAQAVAISMMLWYHPIARIDTHQVGLILLYIAALLTLVSMVGYLKSAWQHLR